MRMNLKVPFAEKEQAKKLGARWDSAQKVWYVEKPIDMAPFARWSPTLHERTNGGEVIKSPKVSAFMQEGSGKVQVGGNYVVQPKVCDCLPWDSCEKCAHLILKNGG
ncbi:MAG: hypothetical protein JNJ95_06070 [Dechloromonas sp.]|nr:hypothetical protein [Dechloromonas sp.]